MINIDTVYQKVLTFASKEQRGYITPQEFNLLANQAQMEIFEQYFYDYNQFQRVAGNDTVYADVDDILEEKIQIFETSDSEADIALYPQASQNPNLKELPDYIYRIEAVYTNMPGPNGKRVKCEILNTKDFEDARNGGYLTRPNSERPVFNYRDGVMRTVGAASDPSAFFGLILPTEIFYIRKPNTVNWGYFVVSGKALYNASASVSFELHPAEETELVYKILKYAGVSMQRGDIMKAGQGMETLQVQQEKQ